MSFKNVYFNGDTNKPFALSESDSLIVMRTSKLLDVLKLLKGIKSLTDYKDDLTIRASFPQSNVHIFDCSGKSKGQSAHIKSLIKEAKNENILYAGSVFQYKNSSIYQIYTENIFLKFHDDVSKASIRSFLKSKGLVDKRPMHFGKNAYFLEYESSVGREIFESCHELLSAPEVKFCHPEMVTKLRPAFREFQNLPSSANVNLPNEWWLNRCGVQKAWNHTRGEGATIAVIDDGLDFDHVAFQQRIVHPKDLLDKTGTKLPKHEFSEKHGTASASIATSNAPNAVGVAPRASIMPIKLTGVGSVLQSEAFYWAVQNGADVISCAWGPPDGSIFNTNDDNFEFPLPDHTRLAFDYATTHGRKGKGCTIVFAAGNGKEPVKHDGYASSDKVLAVGAVNYKDKPTIYSDYGEPMLCCFPSGDYKLSNDNKVEEISGIHVADRVGEPGYSRDDYYSLFSGTSASCPGVAGVVALLYSAYPQLNKDQVKDILIASCEKIGQESSYKNGYSTHYGYGLLRADKVMEIAQKKHLKKSNNMESSKKNAISLHIGINVVDQDYYAGFVNPLSGCVNDMNNMGAQASSLGYDTHFLKDEEATRSAIRSSITDLGNQVEDGGILMITYAGHGAPLRDEDGDEKDGKDEAWVTYDGFFLDDEIYNALAAIEQNIRVVVVSDSCHSESITRFLVLPDSEVKYRSISHGAVLAILKHNNSSLEELRGQASARSSSTNVFVINLSACLAKQLAQEVNGNGVFTTQLIVELTNRLNHTYNSFIDQIRRGVASANQIPNITTSHNVSEAFLAQNPFDTTVIALSNDGGGEQPPQPDTPDQTDQSASKANERLYLDADNLIIETEDETEVVINPMIASRGGEIHSRTVNISDDTIDAAEIRGHTDWDKAYNLLLANQDKNIASVEPDTVSNMYFLDSADELSRGTAEDANGYLHTYPYPEDDTYPDPFIWHLDDGHSQLRKANEHVFPEVKMGKRNTSKTDVVKIAHIDTGFLPNHPSMPVNFNSKHVSINGGRIKGDAVDETESSFQEQQGHGQATMAILAGGWVSWDQTDNQYEGFFGAIPYAEVLTIKISETVALLSGKNFAKAIDYAIEQNCDVITMSMAGLPSKRMAKAINKAYNKGIIIVSAASNSFSKGGKRALPKKTLYPARYDRVISAVGATFKHTPYLNSYNPVRAAGGLYMQTCYGPAEALPTSLAAYTPNIRWFDQNITKPDGSKSYYVKTGGGTSSATPQAAAAAALYLQKYKKELDKYSGDKAWMKAEIVRQALFRSADKSTAYNHVFGNGILRAHDALQPEFAPAKIATGLERARKAPEKRRLFGGLFKVLLGRSVTPAWSKDTEEKLRDMMACEITQLLYKDPNLFDYAEQFDLESEELNIEDQDEFVAALLNSEHASDFLKSSLSNEQSGIADQDHDGTFFNAHYEGVGERGGFSVMATNLKPDISNRRSYKEYQDEQEYWVDEFEIKVNTSRSMRGDLGTNLEILLDKVDELDSALLLTTEYEDDVIYQWKVPEIPSKDGPRSLSESLVQEGKGAVYSLTINDFQSQQRGIGTFIKRTVVKLFKWKKVKEKVTSKVTDKLLSKLGDNKYKLMVFDLEDGNQNSGTAARWIDMNTIDDQKIIDEINTDNKPLMLMLHGLFSNVQGGFDDFLENEEARKKLASTHCRYVLGCNMPTVVHGIAENAETIDKMLRGKLKSKSCSVLTHSRGGIVARYLIESLWLNKNTKTLKKNAPIQLRKLIMMGTPNQGTRMASSKNWNSMLNLVTNVAKFTLGTIAPVVPTVLTVVKTIAVKVVDLKGIDDLEEQSKLLEELNAIEMNRDNYFVFTSNFEPSRLLKRLFDEFIVDRKIFKRKANDSVTPVLGAVFQDKDSKTVIELTEDQYYVSGPSDKVSHFGYLHPRNPENIERLFKELKK